MVNVSKIDEKTFQVTVEEGSSSSSHRVTVPDEYYQKLTGGKISKEELVKKSFDFLLERESKGSIMGSFELSIISRFFPEYESEIKS